MRRYRLRPPQQRALLALLLLNASEVVSRDRIDRRAVGGAAACNRRKARPRLRCPAGARRSSPIVPLERPGRILVTRPPGYLIAVEDEQLDLRCLERLRREAREARAAGNPAGAAQKGSRGARPVARAARWRPRLRALCPEGRSRRRGGSPRRARGANRGRSRDRPSRGARSELEALVASTRSGRVCAVS